MELGKAVERVRVGWRPRLRFLRNHSKAQAARGRAAMVETPVTTLSPPDGAASNGGATRARRTKPRSSAKTPLG
jgi:hypothetical protein